MRRLACSLIAALVTFVVVALAPPALGKPDHAGGPWCGIYWGSLEKTADFSSLGLVTDIRAGRHTCFDRLVIDYSGDITGYDVKYVDTVATDGAGVPLDLLGGAFIEITAPGAAHNDAGNLTYRPRDRSDVVDVTKWDTFRQVAWAGDFEGQVTVGLGVRARLPFQVFTLDGPGNGSRLVIDVAHRW
jgi:hypothetical protein